MEPLPASSWSIPNLKSYIPSIPNFDIASKLKYTEKLFSNSLSLIKADADATSKTFSVLASGMELTGLNSLNAAVLSLRSASLMADIWQIADSIGYFAKNFFTDTKVNILEKTGFAVANLNEALSFANDVKIIDLDNSSSKILPALSTAGTVGAIIGLSALSVQTFVTLRKQFSNVWINNDEFTGVNTKELKAKILSNLPDLLSIASSTTELALIALKYVPIRYVPKDSTLTSVSILAKVCGIGSFLFAKNIEKN